MIECEVAFLLRLLTSLSPDGEKLQEDHPQSAVFWSIYLRLSYLGLKIWYSYDQNQWMVGVKND